MFKRERETSVWKKAAVHLRKNLWSHGLLLFAWGGTGHDGRNVQDVQRENVINTIAAMFAADKMGCQVFVEAGSQAEYGTVLECITEETPCHPFSEYGKAKGGLAIMPGDVKWKDINGDGVIDNYDRVKVGNMIPKYTGGMNLSVSWKDLTLSARMDFALGFKTYDYRTPWIMGNMQGTYNTLTNVKDTWSENNPNAKYPIYIWADQLNARNYDRHSTMFCYDGDYLSFREVTLSYNLPKFLVNKVGIENCTLSVTGQNLGYICDAPYVFSPEVSSNSGGYPLPRMLVLGVNVTF